MNRIIPKIQDKFNSYTIISEPYKKKNIWYVSVKCECGKTKEHPTGNLTKLSKCKKCNAKEKYRKYKTGDQKNNLTLIEYLPYKKNNRTMVKALCKCGKFFILSSYEFGKTKCCLVCHKKKSGPEHATYRGTDNITRTYFSNIKINATKRKLKFNLTIKYLDQLLEKQNFKCYISGIPINVHDKTASLDRIDSNIGYIKNNIGWVHKDINRMKSNFSLNYFLKICKQVTNTHTKTYDK